MPDREKLCAKIRALRAKTVANGCTEDEAIAAAEKAAQMLRDHNLTVDEVELRESPFDHHTTTQDDPVGERLWKVADGISHLVGVRYFASAAGLPPSVTFFGFDHEVAVAVYLLEVCQRAMRDELARLEASLALLTPSGRRRRVAPFLDGMADRLRERLRAMKPATPTGTGLVVLRDALIDQAMIDEGLRLKSHAARGSRDFDPAYGAGRAAAERVALNQGIERSGSATALLG